MTERGATTGVLVEACVTTVDEAVGAARSGARRLELCVDLDVGGFTPPLALLDAVRAAVDIPVYCMARRASGFMTTPGEAEAVARDVEALRGAGAPGVVVGFLAPDGRVDEAATRLAVDAAGGLPVTFHRAFDHAPDLFEALETLAALGVGRVLTGGGPGAARDHADTLAELVARGAGRVEILVGGRVRGDHVRHLVEYTGAREVHARAEGVDAVCRALPKT
ncbi:MAG TPA: copper homeostasis protein CutC [Longimicrobiales bacterium]|nr:copper homeostasis protein CutC [Longimicrobiales bacterium]